MLFSFFVWILWRLLFNAKCGCTEWFSILYGVFALIYIFGMTACNLWVFILFYPLFFWFVLPYPDFSIFLMFQLWPWIHGYRKYIFQFSSLSLDTFRHDPSLFFRPLIPRNPIRYGHNVVVVDSNDPLIRAERPNANIPGSERWSDIIWTALNEYSGWFPV